MKNVISVHMPKTAGTSFKAALSDFYHEGLIEDYLDRPINNPRLSRNITALKNSIYNKFYGPDDFGCIHGHFLPLKYRWVSNTNFITWLREPVERLASHYYFWLRVYDPVDAAPLHKRVVEERWSLERFCLGPELRNFYCQFFWGFPIKGFTFIGIMEEYESELQYLSNEFFGSELRAEVLNVNPDSGEGYFSREPALRKKIKAFHKKDVQLYEAVKAVAARRHARPAFPTYHQNSPRP